MNNKNIFIAIIIIFVLLVILIIALEINKKFESNTSESEQEPINIVYITDNQYVPYMRTSIRSIIANKNPDTKIKIYVIGYKLKKKNIRRIKKEARKNVEIKIIFLDPDLIKTFSSNSLLNPFVTRVDNAKFFLTSLLSDIDKVIYLDGDTIILKDLTPLYSIDLKNNYVAAVDDWQTSYKDNLSKRYFNNGIMLLNLKQMRKDDIDKKLTIHKLHDKDNRFVTQDAFNYVMYGKVIYLPLIYDTFAPVFEDERNLFSNIKNTLKKNYNPELYSYPSPKAYQKNVVIIHYCGYQNKKPWVKLDFKRKTNRIWYKYAHFQFWTGFIKYKIIKIIKNK